MALDNIGVMKVLDTDFYALLTVTYPRVRIEYMGREKWPLFSWTGRLLEGVHSFGSHIDSPSPYWGR